jgi:sulfite exporter TauE/SafE
MYDPQAVTSSVAAFAAGAVTSLHCIGMCGPLAGAWMRGSGREEDAVACHLAYHLSRLASYTLVGAVAGGVGQAPFQWMNASPAHWLPWGIVLFFLVVGLGIEHKLPKPQWAARLGSALWAKAGTVPRPLLAAGVGGLSPLLPCGPLYLMFGVALLTGSPLKGAEFTLAFGIGTVPLLWLAQAQFVRWETRTGSLFLRRWLQRGAALVAAAVISWRLVAGPSFEPASPHKPVTCPMCLPPS